MSRRTTAWAAAGCAMTLIAAQGLAQDTTRVSTGPTGFQGNSNSLWGTTSADGRYVAFESFASNLVLNDANFHLPDVFVKDRVTGLTVIVSVDSAGAQGDSGSLAPTISADGRYVAFESLASNLVPGDSNATWDVFVHAIETGTTVRASVASSGAEANQGSRLAALSADGRFVAFESDASNLVRGDANGVRDVFVHDLATGTTERVSVDASGASAQPSVSGDGRFVAYRSSAANLVPGDTNGVDDVFVFDRVLRQTTRASVAWGGAQVGAASRMPSISSDGRYVAFESDASDVVPGDANGASDVFVHDLVTGATERVSLASSGVEGNGPSTKQCVPQISTDGRFVAFDSAASNLVPGDTNNATDCFVHDRFTGATERVNVAATGVQAGGARSAALSSDGRFVAFESLAANLVAGDNNNAFDVFLRDRGPNVPVAFCFGDTSVAGCPCNNHGAAGHGCENSFATGGAVLGGAGVSSLSADTLVLTSAGELPTSLSVVASGVQTMAPLAFGDGLRCVAGILNRLYVKPAVAGILTAPTGTDPTVSARSAALGDPIPFGATRYYFVYYRDPDLAFCTEPFGSTFNSSNALAVVWSP